MIKKIIAIRKITNAIIASQPLPLTEGRYSKNIQHSPHTLIVGEKGKQVELLNSISAKECTELPKELRNYLIKNLLYTSKNGQYKIVIGQGGEGKLRLGKIKNPDTGKPTYIFVKKTHDDQSSDKGKAEAHLIQKLNLNCIPEVYDVSKTKDKNGKDCTYIFMEPLLGGNGRNTITRISRYTKISSELKAQMYLTILKQLLEVIDELSKKGIYHCDHKPENFIFTVDGLLKIVDFGLATTEKNQSSKQGTYKYAAPEKLIPNQVIDNLLADTYSIGVIALECFSITTEIPTHILFISTKNESYRVNYDNVQRLHAKFSEHPLYQLAFLCLSEIPAKRTEPEHLLKNPLFQKALTIDEYKKNYINLA